MNTKKALSRRNFLTSIAAGGSVLAAASAFAQKAEKAAKKDMEMEPMVLLLQKNGQQIKATFTDLTDGNILMELQPQGSREKLVLTLKPDMAKEEVLEFPGIEKPIPGMVVKDTKPKATAQRKRKGKGRWKRFKAAVGKAIKWIADNWDKIVETAKKVWDMIKKAKEIADSLGDGRLPPFIGPPPTGF